MHKQLGRNTVVLLGVGHTNAHVLRMWKMKPPKNAQLVCVSDFPVVTYSGMLPGVIAGQYPKSAMEIDLMRLAQSAGARVVIGRVTGLDRQRRQLQFADRPPLQFDVLSIGIGSRPTFANVTVDPAAPLLPVKPMQTFLDRLGNQLEKTGTGNTKPRIVVVGGGVGSLEIALCLYERFYGRPRHVESWSTDLQPQLQLVTGAQRIGFGLHESTIAKTEQQFRQRNIEYVTDARVEAIQRDGLVLRDGRRIAADIVIWATSAIAGPLLPELGLQTDERGFLSTKQNLQVPEMEGVFAVGDSGTILGSTTSKAGVYAVRQGPILFENIQRLISGQSDLVDYRPQSDFLKIVNFGNDRAVAEYGGRSFVGRWPWKLKDYIDVKFMRKYQTYEMMEMKAEPADEVPMRCLGCGGKIGSQILSQVLDELQIVDQEDVQIGLEHPDDAAIIKTHDNAVTVTTDFFAAPFDDPYNAGRVAALNAASDCFVMGARPTAALAIVQVPLGHPRAQTQIMRELMAGSIREFNAMGAAIVGGHSIEGPRMMIGFTVLGKQLVAPTTKGQLKPGDALILSKPIGTGVLLAAWMQCEMPANCYGPLMDAMLGSNEIALDLVQELPVTALTDVTGFGLIGHLSELMSASGVSVQIEREQVPILPGCQALIDRGIQSTLAPDNRALSGRVDMASLDVESDELAAMFDPQTGGGLLFGIGGEHVESALQFLRQGGFSQAAVIGKVTERAKTPVLRVD